MQRPAVTHPLAALLYAGLNRRIGVTLLLGFSSGLPLALSGSTLQTWLATLHVDITTIAAFSLVGLPYSLKFLWAPFMDRYALPFMGRRRGWILLMQLALAATIALMAVTDPLAAMPRLALFALLMAFLSASQDVVYDAYRTEILAPAERGLGAAATVGGYRLAMIVSGALVLVLSGSIGWRNSYFLMAALMLIALLPTLLGPEPEQTVTPPRTLREAVVEPLAELSQRPAALGLLCLVVLYKFGNWFSGPLTNVFLVAGVHFTPADVGVVNKGLGLVATLIGVFIGGALMPRLGLFRAMLAFGILQAASTLSFMVLAMVGHNYGLMVLAVGIENLAWGMATAAFVAYLMGLCDPRYTAFQFALLSAFDSLSRVLLGPPSGYAAVHLGWSGLFLLSALLCLPGLMLILALQKRIEALETRTPAV